MKQVKVYGPGFEKGGALGHGAVLPGTAKHDGWFPA